MEPVGGVGPFCSLLLGPPAAAQNSMEKKSKRRRSTPIQHLGVPFLRAPLSLKGLKGNQKENQGPLNKDTPIYGKGNAPYYPLARMLIAAQIGKRLLDLGLDVLARTLNIKACYAAMPPHSHISIINT